MPPGLQNLMTELLREVSTPHLRAFTEGVATLLASDGMTSPLKCGGIGPSQILRERSVVLVQTAHRNYKANYSVLIQTNS